MDVNECNYIITIGIQMHGKIICLELNEETIDKFKNVRLYCAAKGFKDYNTTLVDEYFLTDRLQNTFLKDLTKSTYKILPTDKQMSKDELSVIDNIIYDKSLSTTLSSNSIFPDVLNPLQGIYLISVHNNINKLIYPKDKKKLNLIDYRDLKAFSSVFGYENFEDMWLELENKAIDFPEQIKYIEEEEKIKINKNFSEEEKKERIKEIRRAYYNKLKEWSLTIDKDKKKIISIKMSIFVEIIKKIVKENCCINLLDYSCNSITRYIPEKDLINKQYIENSCMYDLEKGIRKDWGGRLNKYRCTKKCLNINGRKNKRTKKRLNIIGHQIKRTKKRQNKRTKNKLRN